MKMANFKLEDIKIKLENISDINYREIKCGRDLVTIVFFKNLCDTAIIDDFVIRYLLYYDPSRLFKGINIKEITKEVILLGPAEKIDTLEEALSYLSSGNILIFFSSSQEVIFCDAKGYPSRAIEQSSTEAVIKGPREGFTEDINSNLSSTRRRLKTPDLKVDTFQLGKQSKTEVNFLYIEGMAPKRLIDYVRRKINQANNKDYILYSNALEETLKCKGTPF